ncbi:MULTISPECIES: GNAT family N-acetyltransferase [Paenarthrobacter]|uniref:GNAT family N-acetyltransferase n=1 Tax=Paenarthrobacter ureafaciens TaxID=37931 RepID=A0AAX3EQ73_PAEUR|nr:MULTISPECIES: GNAT family N-acetyltransferase [Paenarthrobacter]MDO5867116.1 GNAT family N-acetyltransferase [Paenarthrobacter sp. SD-2]MDO5878370.1 GNAT family N-acetyltransferase [Paenarthrobacter sp. SD-1]UYV95597.1 GNAT family N-acetyltransferase [Paenarthrobacter ureafaciens]UYW00281.1 GNAT family N-acetyltransferase [Paenarthrobacter ureafaciens]
MSNIVEVESDADRASVERFFAANIPDPSRRPLVPRDRDPHSPYRSHILAIQEDNEIVAALHAAPPVYEVADLIPQGLPPESGTAALEDFVMLYSIAVSESRRREGLGRELLDRLEQQIAEDKPRVIYGVCASDSAKFYQRSGYDVRPPESMLVLKWGSRNSGFPITGDAQWFTKSVERAPLQTPLPNGKKGLWREFSQWVHMRLKHGFR